MTRRRRHDNNRIDQNVVAWLRRLSDGDDTTIRFRSGGNDDVVITGKWVGVVELVRGSTPIVAAAVKTKEGRLLGATLSAVRSIHPTVDQPGLDHQD